MVPMMGEVACAFRRINSNQSSCDQTHWACPVTLLGVTTGTGIWLQTCREEGIVLAPLSLLSSFTRG